MQRKEDRETVLVSNLMVSCQPKLHKTSISKQIPRYEIPLFEFVWKGKVDGEIVASGFPHPDSCPHHITGRDIYSGLRATAIDAVDTVASETQRLRAKYGVNGSDENAPLVFDIVYPADSFEKACAAHYPELFEQPKSALDNIKEAEAPVQPEPLEVSDEAKKLAALKYISDEDAQCLIDSGYESFELIAAMEPDVLSGLIDGVGELRAITIIEQAESLIQEEV